MRFGREEVKRRSRTRSIAFFFFFLKAIGAFFFFVSFASVTQFHKCSSERHEPDALASRRRSAEVDSVLSRCFFVRERKRASEEEEEEFLNDAAAVNNVVGDSSSSFSLLSTNRSSCRLRLSAPRQAAAAMVLCAGENVERRTRKEQGENGLCSPLCFYAGRSRECEAEEMFLF